MAIEDRIMKRPSHEVARWLPVGLAMAVMAGPVAVEAQDTEWNRYTLENLGGVFVQFEANEACSAAGVGASAYEADVSLRLIDGEVGVLTEVEMLAHPAMPELHVSLDCADGQNGSSGAMAYSVSLRVQQAAQMLRDTQITLPESVTWYTSQVGVTTPGAAVDDVGAALNRSLESFIEAWTAVHATEGEGG